ncbi:MAG: response regulator [Rhodobacteraceae bacterium]|nr:response regulator [Paracoccaceae bacterium]
MIPPTILLVEDEPAQREMLAYNLEAEGFDVITADNGEDGLLMVEENNPDLIILDWMMPQLSGIEVCRRLKSNPKTRQIPVIMLSARAEEVDRVRGLENGADDIVVDLETYKVYRSDLEIKLGPTEFKLLAKFMEKPGRVWQRDQLLDRVWGQEIYVDTRTVDVHIGRLRRALKQHGGQDPIRTVRGAGYALG